ncbi:MULTISPECIES: LysR family transcriptional regulator [Pseudomonas]|uniref:LysR family transcriptional regulator n=1 Tax=Pseudomonas TaxID=286 RepID=UPI000CD16A6E|nr:MULTISPECIES: LysR family transcriptional regulator [unclassified Pseudomonas]POA31787.1 LysR family transcriptional regulator [Pseudomonas sp. GW456-R21]POA68518.1 LysR family transcriptional regulator [Pseudomonas sp. GW460-R15]
MIADIPSPLLRTFVAVVDCGSLAAAARRIARSESALSLQIARLENIVRQPLFDRDGRALRLNHTGGLLLAHARSILGRIDAARAELAPDTVVPVRIGVVQDFVAGVLRPTLTDVLAAAPGTAFSIVIASTAELLQAIGEDRIDAALCAGEPFGANIVTRLPMKWFGYPDLLLGDVVPLVGITLPCPFLLAAQRVLDAAGRPWRMALTTPSLDGLRAAVEAGLGITCRTESGFGLPAISSISLPQLPEIAYSIVERRQGNAGTSLAVSRMTAHLESVAALQQ